MIGHKGKRKSTKRAVYGSVLEISVSKGIHERDHQERWLGTSLVEYISLLIVTIL